MASAPQRVPSVQNVLGNHGALRRPDAAEYEARDTARRVAAGHAPPASVRARASAKAVSSSGSPLGTGRPLPAALLTSMGAALGADFSGVRLHLGRRAAQQTRAARARAVTVGEHIAFGDGLFRPDTVDGRTLIAHELTHVLQQRATGVTRPQFDDDVPTGSGRAATRDLPIYLRVDMRGITVSSPGRRYDPGKPKAPQLMAMVLRRLVTDYEEGLEDDLLARLPADQTVQRQGDFAGDVEAGEDDRMPDAFIELGPLGIIIHALQELGHGELNLTRDQLRILFLGNQIAGWWNDNAWIREQFPWYTPRMFMSHVSLHGQLIADMQEADTRIQQQTPGAVEEFQQAELVFTTHILEAIGVVDEIRLDLTLAEDPEAGGLWRTIWGDPGRTPPSTVQRQDVAIQLISYYWGQRALGRRALVDPAARLEFMQRFSRWLGRTSPSVTAQDVTQRLIDQPGQATDPPFPATLAAFPPPHGPAHALPASSDHRFEFAVQFPDVFSAFTHYHYAWDVIRWEATEGEEQAAVEEVGRGETDAATRTEGADEATMGDVVAARLSRDLRDAATDIERIHDTFGPAGVTVAGALYLNALVLRPIGTLIESFVDLVTLSAGPGRRERPIQFPEPGVFVVRVSAIPVVDDIAEIRRPPSVAYMAIFAQDEADFARAQLDQAIDASTTQDEARADYTETVRELLEEETDPELRATLEHLLREATRDESYWPRLQAMKERADTRITELDEEIARLRRERPASGAQRREADRTIALLQAERERTDTQRDQLEDLLDTHAGRSRDYPQLGFAEPLYVGFVSDEGEARQLTMEWASLNPTEASVTLRLGAPDGSVFVVVSDHTSANGGVDEGYGSSQDEAIVHAVRRLLESRFGYGRGEASIRLPGGGTRALRIERDLGSLASEAVENVSLVITVAAVAAAPFTGGSSLTILVPLGFISGGHAAYRIYTRYEASTLRWDLQTAMDLVDIVGAFVQGGAALRAGRAGMSPTRFGRILAVSYEFAEEGTGYILLGGGLEQQLSAIESNTEMSDGEKRARRVMALGSAMLQAGIMVGQRVFKQGADDLRAAREELGRIAETTGDDATAGASTDTTPPATAASEARAEGAGLEVRTETPAPEVRTETPVPETRRETAPSDANAETPEVATPEAATPDTATPEAVTPEAATPDAATPEVVTPEATAPEAATPEAVTPEAVTPEAATPETVTPEAATPEAVTPEAATPEAATPEAATPDAATAEATTPEAVTPQAEAADSTTTPEETASAAGTDSLPGPEVVITPLDQMPAPDVVLPADTIEGTAPAASEVDLTPDAATSTPEVISTPEVTETPSLGAPSVAAAPRTRSQLEQAVRELIAPDGRFADADLEAAYGRYGGDASRAEWAWRTRGGPLERLRTLLGPDFRPARAPAASAPEATAVEASAGARETTSASSAMDTPSAATEAPQVVPSDTVSPEVAAPAGPEASAAASDADAGGATADATTPEAMVADQPTRDVSPEGPMPEVAPPETTAADTATPEGALSQAGEPAVIQPDATQSETAQPETAPPETAPPETAQPETAPETAQPETATPEAAAPAVAAPSRMPSEATGADHPLAGVSENTLRRRVNDPAAPADEAAHAELMRRYRERPISDLVRMVRRDSRWDAPYARRVLEDGGGRRGTVAEYLAEVGSVEQLRDMARYDPAAAEALVERYYRDFSPQQLENLAEAGDQTAQYVLDRPRPGPAMDPDVEASLVEEIWNTRRTASEEAEAEAARTDDPAVRQAAEARAAAAREAGTVGAMETDIPGITGTVVRGSPNAPAEGAPRDDPSRHVRPETSVALAHYHAEEGLLNHLISRIQEARLGPEELAGRTVRIVVDQQVCSYCLSGLASGDHAGILQQFTDLYPGLRVEITDLRTGDFVVLSGGHRTLHERRAGTIEDR